MILFSFNFIYWYSSGSFLDALSSLRSWSSASLAKVGRTISAALYYHPPDTLDKQPFLSFWSALRRLSPFEPLFLFPLLSLPRMPFLGSAAVLELLGLCLEFRAAPDTSCLARALSSSSGFARAYPGSVHVLPRRCSWHLFFAFVFGWNRWQMPA